MADEPTTTPMWRMLIADLMEVRTGENENQEDLDEVLIARYLDGKCDEDERAHIDRVMEENPEVAEQIRVLTEVLAESDETPPSSVQSPGREPPDRVWAGLVSDLQAATAEVGEPWSIDEELAVARLVEEGKTDPGNTRATVEQLQVLREVLGEEDCRPATRTRRSRFWASFPRWGVTACVVACICTCAFVLYRAESLAQQIAMLQPRPDVTRISVPGEPAARTKEQLPKTDAFMEKLQSLEKAVEKLEGREVNPTASTNVPPPVDAYRVSYLAVPGPEPPGLPQAVRGHGISFRETYTVCRIVGETALPSDQSRAVARPVCETVTRQRHGKSCPNPADRPPTPSPQVLVEAFQHPNTIVQWAVKDVLNGLAKTDSIGYREEIIDSLLKEDRSGRAAAKYITTECMPEVSCVLDFAATPDLLDKEDPLVRWAALYGLVPEASRHEESGPGIRTETKAPSQFYTPAAEPSLKPSPQELGRSDAPNSAASPTVPAATTAPDPTVRTERFSAENVSAVIDVLRREDEAPLVRRMAIYVLGEMGTTAEPALGDLVAVLKEESDPQMRRWAAFAVGKMGPAGKAAMPDLVRILCESPSEANYDFEQVFPAVAYAVGKLGRSNMTSQEIDRVQKTLRERMKHSDPSVRTWAAATLLNLESERLKPSADRLNGEGGVPGTTTVPPHLGPAPIPSNSDTGSPPPLVPVRNY